jgi:tetratricopeptide (TPR) repeat protein
MKRMNLKKGLFLTAVLAGVVAVNNYAQELNSALLLTKSELYDRAADMLQQLIQKEPSNSKYYFYLGENTILDYYADTISNSFTFSMKSAKDIFQKGVNANPSDPLNYTGLAKVAFLSGDDKTADEMRAKARSFLLPYKKIKKIVPPAKEYAYALAKIAESYINLNDREVDTSKALPLIRQAISIDSKNKDIFLIAGDIYIMANDGSNAIKNYNLAQFVDPNSPTAAMKIGSIYVRGKSLNAAIPYFEEAIGLDANFAPAYRELGQLYWMAQRLEQSKENYKKYLELSQGNIPAQTRYVTSLFYAGDYNEVIKNVEEILAVDKSRAFLNRLAGYSYYEMKNPDYEKALQHMEELLKAIPEDRVLWKDHNYMARILMKKNQHYPKLLDELSNAEQQLDKEQSRYSSAAAAMKPKIKPDLDKATARVANLKTEIANSDKELDRGFAEYEKVLEMKPQDRGVMSEMASYYNTYKRYDKAAHIWFQLINPANERPEEYLQIGRAYYNAEKFKTADSVFNLVVKKWPDNTQAYLWIGRTYSKMDPDSKLGLAKPKFEKVLNVSKADSIKNAAEIIESCGYLGYYHMITDNYNQSKEYYNRMININPDNKEAKIRGYNGLGQLEIRMASNEKTNEGRLPFLAKAAEAYDKILEIDPDNVSAKSQLNYVHEFEAQVKKGINPNEIKGVVKDAATGQPIPYASIRVKDTAAENLTNTKGEYKFEIPQGSEVLIISAKGYATKEIPITKSRVYNVSLEK